jgi:hypothetical protein
MRLAAVVRSSPGAAIFGLGEQWRSAGSNEGGQCGEHRDRKMRVPDPHPEGCRGWTGHALPGSFRDLAGVDAKDRSTWAIIRSLCRTSPRCEPEQDGPSG